MAAASFHFLLSTISPSLLMTAEMPVLALRATHLRVSTARSANTGISAVISNTGEIVESRNWDEAAAIKFSIPVVDGETFYVENGSLIFRLAVFLMIALLGYHFVMILKNRFIGKQ